MRDFMTGGIILAILEQGFIPKPKINCSSTVLQRPNFDPGRAQRLVHKDGILHGIRLVAMQA
jgi:hypothetical protein